MKRITLVILSFICINSYAQVPVNTEADGSIFWGNALPIERAIPYSEIKGSPYHNEQFIMGSIRFKADTLRRYLRYNAYTDEIEYVNKNNQVQSIADMFLIRSVEFGGLTYKWEKFTQGFTVDQGFFVELVGGRCRLLKREIVEFEPAKPPKTSYHQPTPNKFVPVKPDYYYSCPNQILEPFTNSGNQLRKLSSGDLRSVEDFIKDKKLKMRKEEDMITLFRYLNGQVDL